jgi:hypothetical protein
MFPIPPTTFVHSDRTPDLDSNDKVIGKGSPFPSTPTLAHKTDGIKTPNLKRSIDEAFNSKHLDSEIGIKQLHFQLRKAQARLALAKAKAE